MDALNNELTLRIEGLETDLISASTYSIPFANGEIMFLARYIVLIGDHTEDTLCSIEQKTVKAQRNISF